MVVSRNVIWNVFSLLCKLFIVPNDSEVFIPDLEHFDSAYGDPRILRIWPKIIIDSVATMHYGLLRRGL